MMKSNKNKDNIAMFFLRISFGLFLMIHFMSIYLDFEILFGSTAIIPNEINNLYISENTQNLSKIYLSFTHLIDYTTFINLFKTLYLLFCLNLVLGLLTRLSSFLLIILHYLMIKNNVFLTYGVDYYSSIILTIIFLFPTNNFFSVDKKIKVFQLKLVTEEYFLKSIRIFLSISYFFSGFNKIIGYNWRNGESIWKMFNLPMTNSYISSNMQWMSSFPIVPIIIGWFVITLEICYFLINLKFFRYYILISIVIFHVSIAITLQLYFFSTLMIIINLTAYYNFNQLEYE